MGIGPVTGAAIYFHIVQGSLTNSVIHDCGMTIPPTMVSPTSPT
jgi:hypothetical protein